MNTLEKAMNQKINIAQIMLPSEKYIEFAIGEHIDNKERSFIK